MPSASTPPTFLLPAITATPHDSTTRNLDLFAPTTLECLSRRAYRRRKADHNLHTLLRSNRDTRNSLRSNKRLHRVEGINNRRQGSTGNRATIGRRPRRRKVVLHTLGSSLATAHPRLDTDRLLRNKDTHHLLLEHHHRTMATFVFDASRA